MVSIFRLLIFPLLALSQCFAGETVTLYIACENDEGQSLVRSVQYDLATHQWDAKPGDTAVVPAKPSRLTKDPIFPFIYSVSRRKDSHVMSAIRIQDGTSRIEAVPSLDRNLISQSFPILNSSSTHWLTTRESILQPRPKHGKEGEIEGSADPTALELNPPGSLILSDDGRWVIWTHTSERQIRVYKLDTAGSSRLVHKLQLTNDYPPPAIVSLHPTSKQLYALSADGTYLFTCSFNQYNGTPTLLEAKPLSEEPSQMAAETAEAKMAIQPGGDLIYVSDRSKGGLVPLVRNPATGQLRRLPTCISEMGAIGAFAFDASGRWLVASTMDKDEVRWFTVRQADATLEAIGPPLKVRRPSSLLLVTESHCCGN